ncbi:hypothetical protein [Rickettsia bellii]|nr:hypothetical protein [Rickettsia bellii]
MEKKYHKNDKGDWVSH